jgi:hypothetical protein
LKEAIEKKTLHNYRAILNMKKTIFWHKGFDILHNINDRMTLEKEIKQAKDPIFSQPKTKKA